MRRCVTLFVGFMLDELLDCVGTTLSLVLYTLIQYETTGKICLGERLLSTINLQVARPSLQFVVEVVDLIKYLA